MRFNLRQDEGAFAQDGILKILRMWLQERCADTLMDVPVMYPQQIKDEIRKLNWVDRVGLYRWINEEIAGRPGIGADRSLQIREEIERMCNAAHLKTHFIEGESANPSSTLSLSSETRRRLRKK
jgi:hypothetical protein